MKLPLKILLIAISLSALTAFGYWNVSRHKSKLDINWQALSDTTKYSATYVQLNFINYPTDETIGKDIKTSKHNSQGYILAIDSFVLKFEGLLREFSRMIGAQTIEIKENGTEERINFEKLLDNEKLKALIPEDDIAYFKFLFTSQGMNLRNNIAHSFYNTSNYTSAVMLLLIVALFRLGNYKIEPKEKDA